MSLKEITMEEVTKHNKADDCWIVIGNEETGGINVYDVTEYLDDHPGGPEVLADVAGQDADEFFEDLGHSKHARRILKRYMIGTLKINEAERKSYLESREKAAQDRADTKEKLSKYYSKLKSTKFKVDVDLHDKNVKNYTYYSHLVNEAVKRIQIGLECRLSSYSYIADSDSIESPTDYNNATTVNIKVIKCNPGINEGSTCCGERRNDVAEFDISWDVSNDNDGNVVASGKKSYTAPSVAYDCLGIPFYSGEKFIFDVTLHDISRDIFSFMEDYFCKELDFKKHHGDENSM